MDALVERLREQHRELETLSQALTTALHQEQLEPVQAALQAFGAALLNHLALEDDTLYPRLLKLVDGRSPDGRMIRTFSENMRRVSEVLKVFLSRTVDSAADLPGLRKEWPETEHLLTSRIQSEERLLFPMYEERSTRA